MNRTRLRSLCADPAKAAIRRVLECAIVGLCLCAELGAQIPAGFVATSPRQTELGPLLPQELGQYRSCTPAEYGDPAADCVPARSNSAFGAYDDLETWGLSPGFANQQAYPFANNRVQQPSASRANAGPGPVVIEKDPPTEFQQYVAASTGHMLPLFGAALFEGVPATFAPLERVAVGRDYVIAPGDELQVTAWGQFNLTRRVIVDRTGQVTLPDVGPVAVAGMTYAQAEATIKSAMGRLYKNFDLTVTLGRLHSIQIFVVGEARRPGSYTVSSMSTLVNAIFACGGPSSRGSMRSIKLKRGTDTIRDFDLYELLLDGDKSKDAQLQSGDVILIPAARARVAIAGSVQHAGIYELGKENTLADALRLADGLSALAARREAVLERVLDGSGLRVLRVSLTDEGLRTRLHDGDIVRILPIVRRFEGAVTIRGNVADAGRFPWHAGMRLSDVIPDKESLLTRNYWSERNGIGMMEDDRQSTPGPDTGAADGDAVNSDAGTQSTGSKDPAHVAQVAFLEQKRDTRADGSLGAAMGIDNVPPLRTFVPHNTVQPFAPEINWEYAVIERMDPQTLATRIIPFNLGKLVLRHEPSEDLQLQQNDVITVFSKADFSIPGAQQSKQVRLEGEIARAGVYTVLPGETLRDVVKRAGGLTQSAYLYGAQFTREATRREQQKRYDDFLTQFEREVNEGAANLSSRVTSPQQAATAQTSLSSQRDLIERLRKVSMNGRIVLDMDPTSKGENALPELALENGDRLFVPSRPSTVNVIGTVFEQASFLFEEDLRVGDYLKKAGGPARSADRSHMFVIRADGSVISKSTGTVLFAKSFDGLAMHPGDTLIVPTYINRSSFVRSLMDWSQVFSNMALGAAAVNVLH